MTEDHFVKHTDITTIQSYLQLIEMIFFYILEDPGLIMLGLGWDEKT